MPLMWHFCSILSFTLVDLFYIQAAWPTNGLQMARLMEECIEEINSTQESALITPGGSSAKASPKVMATYSLSSYSVRPLQKVS